MTPLPLLPGVTLILGGARSGKSRLAEAMLEAASENVTYIATAQAFDREMAERIAIHQERRGSRWRSIEEPLELTQKLKDLSQPGMPPILVDCLTLWLTNLMLGEHSIEANTQDLLRWIATTEHPTVLVSNEVGLGIVPDNALARRFRDEAGRLNQAVASAATAVYFVAAGLPMRLK